MFKDRRCARAFRAHYGSTTPPPEQHMPPRRQGQRAARRRSQCRSAAVTANATPSHAAPTRARSHRAHHGWFTSQNTLLRRTAGHGPIKHGIASHARRHIILYMARAFSRPRQEDHRSASRIQPSQANTIKVVALFLNGSRRSLITNKPSNTFYHTFCRR